MKSTLIFMHIPKTAGTTLARIFKENYFFWPPGRVFIADAREKDKRLREMDESHRKRIKLIHGHIQFGVHRLLSQDCIYVTYLRDPVKRVVSFYNYIHETPSHYLYDAVKSGKMSLPDLLRARLTHELDNLQVRMIAGVEKDVPIGGITEKHLEMAMANIDQWFPAVGVTQYFDESLLLMRNRIDWNFFPYYVPGKVTKVQQVKYPVLSDEIISSITEANRFDCELYGTVKQRIENQIAEGGESFQADLVRFRKRNRRYQAVIKYLPLYN